MTRIFFFLVIVIAMGASTVSVRAADSCLPDFISLDAFQDTSARAFSLPLASRNTSGPFVTHATLEGQWSGETLSLTFRFNFDGVSLPYNIYAVLVVSEKDALAWRDLTNGCTGPGVGIYPSQSYALPAIKTSAAPKSGWHIIVWGRL